MSIAKFSHLQNNVFWSFLHSNAQQDRQRRQLLNKIISIIRNDDVSPMQLYHTLYQRYQLSVTLQDLRELFSVDAADEISLFSQCIGLFYVDNWRICYIDSGDVEAIEEKPFIDIFKLELQHIKKKAIEIGEMGDKIAKILRTAPEYQLDVVDLLMRVNHTPKNVYDDKTFIGYIEKYLDCESLTVKHDSQFNGGIAIQLKEFSYWPSTRNVIVERQLLNTSCSYPGIVDIDGYFSVEIMPCTVPSDGFFMKLNTLNAERDYVELELKFLYDSLYNGDPLNRLAPYQGRPCLLEHDGRLLRAKITGQTGDGRAAVECVDEARIIFTTIEYLYEIPGWLLGVPATGIYGVLSLIDGYVFLMSRDKALKKKWRDLMKAGNSSSRVYIIDKTAESEYSGLRKSVVYKVQLKVTVDQKEEIIVPDHWQPNDGQTERRHKYFSYFSIQELQQRQKPTRNTLCEQT